MSEPETVTDLVERMPQGAPALPAVVTPMTMLQIAIERGADLPMLEKLMDLQERWEAKEARKAFVVAMNAFKASAPTLAKNKHVKYGNTEYDHATLDQACTVVGAALSQHGLSHRWDVEQGEHERITVACVITHELGHSERVSMSATPDKSGSKNPIQAIGSATTYLQRYTLLAVTGLAAKDQDDDGRKSGDGESISAEQKTELIALMKEKSADPRKFLDFLNVPTLDDLPASRFAEAKTALLRKKAKAP